MLFLRYKLGLTSVLGIICGTRDKSVKLDMRPFMGIMNDELSHIAKHGVRVFNGHKKEYFTCVARLVQVMSDYRGIEKFLEISGSPVNCACYK